MNTRKVNQELTKEYSIRHWFYDAYSDKKPLDIRNLCVQKLEKELMEGAKIGVLGKLGESTGKCGVLEAKNVNEVERIGTK